MKWLSSTQETPQHPHYSTYLLFEVLAIEEKLKIENIKKKSTRDREKFTSN